MRRTVGLAALVIATLWTLQSHQYRITYECPANANAQARIQASVSRAGTPFLSIDGHLP
jgi:hypothetical protein